VRARSNALVRVAKGIRSEYCYNCGDLNRGHGSWYLRATSGIIQCEIQKVPPHAHAYTCVRRPPTSAPPPRAYPTPSKILTSACLGRRRAEPLAATHATSSRPFHHGFRHAFIPPSPTPLPPQPQPRPSETARGDRPTATRSWRSRRSGGSSASSSGAARTTSSPSPSAAAAPSAAPPPTSPAPGPRPAPARAAPARGQGDLRLALARARKGLSPPPAPAVPCCDWPSRRRGGLARKKA